MYKKSQHESHAEKEKTEFRGFLSFLRVTFQIHKVLKTYKSHYFLVKPVSFSSIGTNW